MNQEELFIFYFFWNKIQVAVI